jgi:pimeloyl-ACP methyl ester carboxylesterase
MGTERTSLLAGGTRTRLVQAGPADSAEAVVFVHGNPGSADDWEGLIGAAAGTGRRALAFDLPDFGETIAPDGFAHDVPAYATFVDEALAELGVERVHLVIHDFGGPIGLVWTMMHPDALASITLIDTGVMPG